MEQAGNGKSDRANGGYARQLMDIRSLSEFLKLPVRTIYQWTYQNKVPHIKLGRCLRFDPETILEWLERKRVAPAP